MNAHQRRVRRRKKARGEAYFQAWLKAESARFVESIPSAPLLAHGARDSDFIMRCRRAVGMEPRGESPGA